MFLFYILDSEIFLENLNYHILKVYHRKYWYNYFFPSASKENYAKNNDNLKNHHRKYFIGYSTFKSHVV